MVDVAKYFMEFCMSESCGKCIPCRAGTQQMHGLLEKITAGEGPPRIWRCSRNSATWSATPASAAWGNARPTACSPRIAVLPEGVRIPHRRRGLRRESAPAPEKEAEEVSEPKPPVRVKTLTIDGREVGAREDQTILEVARENDIFIPTLCDLAGLSTVGACRLCLVEIKGAPSCCPACVTLVAEGMEVTVNSDRLAHYRRGIMELLFAERNHVCSVCVTNGHCDLQSLALKLGVTHVHFPYQYPSCPWTHPTSAS
jgi:hypothetical protein